MFCSKGWLVLPVLLISAGVAAAKPPARTSGSIQGEVKTVGLSVGSRVRDVSEVLLFVEGVTAPVPKAKQRYEIVQKGRQFEPRLLVVPTGAEVWFPNADDVQHNVFSLAPNASFDLPLYRRGESRSVIFESAAVVPVFCNIHPQMRAHVVAVSNPYYVHPAADGSFQLSGVPEGTHNLVAWHPSGKLVRTKVQVVAGSVLKLDPIVVRETTIGVTHLDKDGKKYGAY